MGWIIFFVLIFWFGLSLLVGKMGEPKTIGFAGAFLISFLTSPFIGLIVVLVAAEKPKMEIRNPIQFYPSGIDQDVVNSIKATEMAKKIQQLNELREKGALTESHYQLEKFKILNE